MIEEYTELHSMMLERADHISKIFGEVDDDMEWWAVKDYVDYDVTFSFGHDAIMVAWDYKDPYEECCDEHHYHPFLNDFFESATDDELKEYAMDKIAERRQKNKKESLRSVLYGLHENRDFIDFMQTVTLPEELYFTDVNEIIEDYLAWKNK